METTITKKKCSKCFRGTLDYRTPRGFWVKTLLFWLPIRRYRCGYCDKKTYLYGSSNVESSNDNTSKLQVVKTED